MTAMLYRLQLARSERVPAKTERGKGIIGGVRAPVCNDCAGRGRAPTAGLQHAPSGSVEAVERMTRRLRIEGLAAAALVAV